MAAPDTFVTINRRFNGPPDSGNGGYVCGMLARNISGPAQVTLRRPIPLDRPLRLVADADGVERLLDADQTVAEARPTTVDLDVPEPPSFEVATAATQRFRGFEQHTFPTCFVCGPDRAEGDGLRLFTGPVPERELVAAPWVPDASLGDAEGVVREEFVWAALDCPGAFALSLTAPMTPMVLGDLQAQVLKPVHAGRRYVVVGWPRGAEGRKHYAGTAVFDEAGVLHAKAKAIWIALAR